MNQSAIVPSSSTTPAATAEELERKLVKKQQKLRSAWISFVGRIVAQVMGAAATISLGLMLVHKYQSPVQTEPDNRRASASESSAAPVRQPTSGGSAVAVLPFDTFSSDADKSFAA